MTKRRNEEYMQYCKIIVTNITSDEIVDCLGIKLHHVICDCTVENTNNTEKAVSRIFSKQEYEMISKYGYYLVLDLDAE